MSVYSFPEHYLPIWLTVGLPLLALRLGLGYSYRTLIHGGLMRQFPVDEDVVTLVWQRANPKPFEQLSFSNALRRVLSSQSPQVGSSDHQEGSVSPSSADSQNALSADDLLAELDIADGSGRRRRAPKADLGELVRMGLLRNGQELFFIDYRGNRRGQHKASVSGGNLLFKGQIHSMSALSRALLKKEGFSSDSVRGPEHWATSEGTRVVDLWEKVLASRAKQ